MLSLSDPRASAPSEDRFQQCLGCGKTLVLLPDDRRGGNCFDCFSLLGSEAIPCPECGQEIPTSLRAAGCPACGWSALRD